jgi:hypothetical protein
MKNAIRTKKEDLKLNTAQVIKTVNDKNNNKNDATMIQGYTQ